MFAQASVSHSVHNRPHGYSVTAHPCWLLGHCSSLLRRGRYAFYWNAFLFSLSIYQCSQVPYPVVTKSINSLKLHFRTTDGIWHTLPSLVTNIFKGDIRFINFESSTILHQILIPEGVKHLQNDELQTSCDRCILDDPVLGLKQKWRCTLYFCYETVNTCISVE